MSGVGMRRGEQPVSRWRYGKVALVLLAAGLAAGCDQPFDPYAEHTAGPFAIYGYLDLRADTQWVRLTPIRQNLLTEPGPIDATVTLEHLGTGRVVTLRDSIVPFTDRVLGGVGYTHNFLTTERLEPEATYRLVATRSDGASTTATVEIPPQAAMSLRFVQYLDEPWWQPRLLSVSGGEHLLYAELLVTVWNTTGEGWPEDPYTERLRPHHTSRPGDWRLEIPLYTFPWPHYIAPLDSVGRMEAHVVLTRADWPFEPGLSPTEAAVHGNLPTTVENGIGFLVGVDEWRIPLPRCYPTESRPDGREICMTVIDESSTSIVGQVVRDPCGVRQLPTVRLTERYADGGSVDWTFKPGWGGEYRFEGLEPGSELTLEFGGHPAGTIEVPPLAPGERYYAPFTTMPSSC
jgi:hypothetical protein